MEDDPPISAQGSMQAAYLLHLACSTFLAAESVTLS
jgi:hypothetical protein